MNSSYFIKLSVAACLLAGPSLSFGDGGPIVLPKNQSSIVDSLADIEANCSLEELTETINLLTPYWALLTGHEKAKLLAMYELQPELFEPHREFLEATWKGIESSSSAQSPFATEKFLEKKSALYKQLIINHFLQQEAFSLQKRALFVGLIKPIASLATAWILPTFLKFPWSWKTGALAGLAGLAIHYAFWNYKHRYNLRDTATMSGVAELVNLPSYLMGGPAMLAITPLIDVALFPKITYPHLPRYDRNNIIAAYHTNSAVVGTIISTYAIANRAWDYLFGKN